MRGGVHERKKTKTNKRQKKKGSPLLFFFVVITKFLSEALRSRLFRTPSVTHIKSEDILKKREKIGKEGMKQKGSLLTFLIF